MCTNERLSVCGPFTPASRGGVAGRTDCACDQQPNGQASLAAVTKQALCSRFPPTTDAMNNEGKKTKDGDSGHFRRVGKTRNRTSSNQFRKTCAEEENVAMMDG